MEEVDQALQEMFSEEPSVPSDALSTHFLFCDGSAVRADHLLSTVYFRYITSHPGEKFLRVEYLTGENPSSTLLCYDCDEEAIFYCPTCEESICESHDASLHEKRPNNKHQRLSFAEHPALAHQQVWTDVIMATSSPGEHEESYKKNLFLGETVVEGSEKQFVLGAKFHLLRDALGSQTELGVISVTGHTHNGKSLIIRALLAMDGAIDLPLAGEDNHKSTTSGMQAYFTSWELKEKKRRKMVFWDNQGLGGTTQCVQGTETSGAGGEVVYSRLAYLFSSVLCYVHRGAPADIQSLKNDLENFTQLAAARNVNAPSQPVLCIIYNRQTEECNEWVRKPGDEPGECIENSTKRWKESYPDMVEFLAEYFSEVHVIHIPDYKINRIGAMAQISELRELLRSLQKRISHPFTSGWFQDMWDIGKKLYADPKCALDCCKLLLKDDAFRDQLDRSHAGAMWHYFKALLGYYYDKEGTSHASFSKALSLYRHVLLAQYQILWHRLCDKIGASGDDLERKFRPTWKEDLKSLGTKIAGCSYCSATETFACAKRGAITVKCSKVGEGHRSHYNPRIRYIKVESPGLFKPNFIPRACTWGGAFDSSEGSVSEVEEKFDESTPLSLRETMKEILSLVPLKELASRDPRLCGQICLLCGFNFPSTTLSCSHSVCWDCYAVFSGRRREPNSSESGDECENCPICMEGVDLVHRVLPATSGSRILSLDGGGNRQSQLVVLRKILQLLKDSRYPALRLLTLHDLFDLMVGTGVGGVIALYLSTHKEETALQDLEGILTTWALGDFDDSLWFKFLRWFDVWKNDGNNLLKYLENKLGKRPLRGCTTVGGPVVAVTMVNEEAKLQIACSSAFLSLQDVDVESTAEYEIGYMTSIAEAARVTSSDSTCRQYPTIQGNRKSSGSLVANCPTADACRIANQLWPDAPIDALLSIGTGSSCEPLALSRKDVFRSLNQTVYLYEESDRQALGTEEDLRNGNTHFCRSAPDLSTYCGLHLRSLEQIEQLKTHTEESLEESSVKQMVSRLVASMYYVELFTRNVGGTLLFVIHNRKEAQIIEWKFFDFTVKDENGTVLPITPSVIKNREGSGKQSNFELVVEFTLTKGNYTISVDYRSEWSYLFPISGCPFDVRVDPELFV